MAYRKGLSSDGDYAILSDMKQVHWLPALLAVLLLVMGGLAAWAYAHRGYPYVVYYARYLALPSSTQPQVTIEEWVDPRQHRLRLRSQSTGDIYTALSTDGFTYETSSGTDGLTQHMAPTQYSEPAYQVKVDRALLAGGWPRLYRGWSSSYHRSPLVPMRYAGHQVLRFTPEQGTTVWLDEHTHLPVQERFHDTNNQFVTDRFIQWARFAAYTLPVTFFDPPHTETSLWDRFIGWVHDRSHR